MIWTLLPGAVFLADGCLKKKAEEELKEKTKRLSELNKELDISNKNDPSTVFVDDEPDENVESRNEMTRLLK